MICVFVATIGVMGAERSRQATSGGVIDPSCNGSLPCIEYDNNGTGPGIRGISIDGNGLAGATQHNSTSLTTGREGVIGNDTSTSGIFNAGVRGLSVRGTGVAGQTTNGTGVSGSSSSGPGVTGSSSNNGGVVGQSNFSNGVVGTTQGNGITVAGVLGEETSNTAFPPNSGVEGISIHGVGVQGQSTTGTATAGVASSYIGVYGISNSTSQNQNGGVYGQSTTGFGVEVYSANSNGVWARSAATPPPIVSTPCPDCEAQAAALLISDYNDGPLIVANSSSTYEMSLDANGNMILRGTLTQSGTPLVVHQTASRASVGAYQMQGSTPSIEDFGEAQLIDGQAYVHLDPTFATTIDPRATYLVFITPLGDSRGLFVTQRSLSGFAVRESQSGRATLAFDYRIVAKPLDSNAHRLPFINWSAHRMSRPQSAMPMRLVPGHLPKR